MEVITVSNSNQNLEKSKHVLLPPRRGQIKMKILNVAIKSAAAIASSVSNGAAEEGEIGKSLNKPHETLDNTKLNDFARKFAQPLDLNFRSKKKDGENFVRLFATQNRNGVSAPRRTFSQLHSPPQPPSFGIAFDVDGVILLGDVPIGGSPLALKRLYSDDSGSLRIPFTFLTNGGGVQESKRAVELSKQLGLNISPSQVIQGHSPFRQLVKRFENDLVIAVGKGEPALVMTEYGFKNVLSIDEYASSFNNIDPLAKHKKWTTGLAANPSSILKRNACSQRVQAAFVVSDSVDWSRDIQVLCDILRTGGLPGKEIAHQPPLYFASDDLEYQALFPSERLGMGAFRIALESIFNSIDPKALEFTSFGKPNPSVFRNAEMVLKELLPLSSNNLQLENPKLSKEYSFKRLYMIGDNPSVDIRGARQAGHPWFSILTRTGVFKGAGNHAEHPADLVVDTVEEAVDYILKTEGV